MCTFVTLFLIDIQLRKRAVAFETFLYILYIYAYDTIMNLIITALLFNFLITGHSLMNPSCHTGCPCEGGANMTVVSTIKL